MTPRIGALVVALGAALATQPIRGQTPGATGGHATASISGVVYDSLARTPLAGAIVQLVPAGDVSAMTSGATTDSAGRYGIDGVRPGRYVIGFMHPVLDSLGLEPTLRAVEVVGERPLHIDLAIPSPARLHRAFCGPPAAGDSSGVVFGILRDAETRAPLGNTSVIAEWLELRLGMRGLDQQTRHFAAATHDNGWFAFCGVPPSTSLGLMGARAADTSGLIQVDVPANGVVRRDLFVGRSETSPAPVDSTAPKDSSSIPLPPPSIRTGNAKLAGIVVTSANGQPITGAHVAIEGGPQAIANERGEWTIANAPPGTRTLEVRAVGFYPESRAVDVIADAPRVRIALSTLKAVLDTVRVTARRIYDRDRNGFQQRRRTGVGRYLGPEDIERMHPLYTSDVFRMVPSMYVSRTDQGTRLLMRGTWGRCSPALYLDGMYIRDLSADDLDGWVLPQDITGIEVYSSAGAPVQYQQMNGCGSIVIWTR